MIMNYENCLQLSLIIHLFRVKNIINLIRISNHGNCFLREMQKLLKKVIDDKLVKK